MAGVENAGPENAGPNLAGVEKAGPPSMEREMYKSKCIMYISKHLSQLKKLLINIT